MDEPGGIPEEPSTSIVVTEEELLDGDLPDGEGEVLEGVAVTGKQDGLFAEFDEESAEPPETSPSTGRSLDDLEREAIIDGLTKLGFKILPTAKFTQEDWRDMRKLLLEHRWLENTHRLVQVIHLLLSISNHHVQGRKSFSSQERKNPKFLAGKLLERLRDMGLKPVVEALALELPKFPEKLPPKLPPPTKKP